MICLDALRAGHKILICGNGGSASQASHFAAELVVRYKLNRRALPCISLTADNAVITACGNDFGYDQVFARQIQALGQKGDVLITLSTSGKSPNVINAVYAALGLGMKVLEAPRVGRDTAEIQENQMHWLHKLAEEIENANLD